MTAVCLAAIVLTGTTGVALAQSGRGRERKPVPSVTAPPVTSSPPAPVSSAPREIPPGGSVVAQAESGAIVRTELANGTVLVVRENPATPVACVTTAVSMPDEATAPMAAVLLRSAARGGVGSPAARVAAVGGMIDVSAEGEILVVVSSVLGTDVDTVLSAHAGLLAATSGSAESLLPGPERTTVVVSGRVNAYGTMTTFQHEFGAIRKPEPVVVQPPPGKRAATRPPAPAIAPSAPSPTPVVSPPPVRYAVRPGATGPAVVTISFDPSPGGAADDAVIEILAATLGLGRTSRLSLAYGSLAIAVDAEAQVEWIASRRRLVVTVAVDAARIDEASAVAWREIDRLRRERISAAELQRARNQAELSDTLRRARSDDDAAELVRLELGSRDVKAASNRLRRVGTVTAADVQATAARMLSLTRASVVETIPAGGATRPSSVEAYATRVLSWAPGIRNEVAPGEVKDRAAMPAATEGDERGRSGDRANSVLVPVPLPVRDYSTLNGPKAFVREDASQPVVAVGMFFPSGRAAETAANRGTTELLLRSMLRGSKQFPGDAALFAIERFGGRVRIVNEPDFFGIVVEVLSRNADLVVPVAIDVVERPQLETVAVIRERDRLLDAQRPSRVPASVAAVNLFWQGRYPTHSYGVSAQGTPESVAKQTDESVRAWYGKSVQALYPLVGIVGDTDGSSLVSRFVVDGFDRPEGERLASPVVPAPTPVAEVATVRPTTTTVVAAGAVTPGGNWEALEAIEIAMRSIQLRVAASSEASAVLHISCGLERRRQAGAALCLVESPVESEMAARAAMTTEFVRVTGASWSNEDIAAGRRCATVALALATARPSEMTVAYVRASAFGLPLDTVERYAELLESLPPDGVRRAAAAILESGRLGRGVVRGVQSR